MKHIDDHYKDWCGEHHTINSCHPVHDSAEACDFAEYCHRQKSDELKESHFNSIEEATTFLSKNNIQSMTGSEMIKKMSESQVIKFAEFLYHI